MLLVVATIPGTGSVRQTVSWRAPGRKRVVSACRAASQAVATAGSIEMACALNAKTRKVLRRRSLTMTVRITYTSTDGAPTRIVRRTVVKRTPKSTVEAVQTKVEAAGPGTITQSGTALPIRARTAKRVCVSMLRITKAGAYDVGCALTPYGASLLLQRDLRVVLTTTYTPKGGGPPVTISRVVYLPRIVPSSVTG